MMLAGRAIAADAPFIPRIVNSSTIPANGDLNPYGVAFVPSGFPSGGTLAGGDVLVSNFNGSGNLQGTGTTIVQLSPQGPLAPPQSAAVFFTSSLTGLSTALGALSQGFVLVGNVPTTDGTFKTIGAGALQVINRYGAVVQTWTDPVFLDGPWDLAIDDQSSTAHVFVSNVLNGTVSRLDLAVTASGVTLQKKATIATGYAWFPNSAALVVGPTGLAFDAKTGTLYVASTGDNAVYAVSGAEQLSTAVDKGTLVISGHHLRGPVGLRFAPNGDLLASNGDAVQGNVLYPSEIVEFTTGGTFVREYNVDASQGGAFGIDTVLSPTSGFNFTFIDDVTNNLTIMQLPVGP